MKRHGGKKTKKKEWGNGKVQMKEDCHSELSWDRNAGMHVQRVCFLPCEKKTEFTANGL